MQDAMAPGLLVSMPNLNDPYFSKTVILLCEYTDETAFGVVINNPSHIQVRDLLAGDDALLETTDLPFLVGGPVQPEFMWGVHSNDFDGESTTHVTSDIYMSSIQEILLSLSIGSGPAIYHLGFGYSGWGPGQLDREIREGAWWVSPIDSDLVLNMPFQDRYDQVLANLGIDPIAANFGTTGEA